MIRKWLIMRNIKFLKSYKISSLVFKIRRWCTFRNWEISRLWQEGRKAATSFFRSESHLHIFSFEPHLAEHYCNLNGLCCIFEMISRMKILRWFGGENVFREMICKYIYINVYVYIFKYRLETNFRISC